MMSTDYNYALCRV